LEKSERKNNNPLVGRSNEDDQGTKAGNQILAKAFKAVHHKI